jgi:hypothetical protein
MPDFYWVSISNGILADLSNPTAIVQGDASTLYQTTCLCLSPAALRGNPHPAWSPQSLQIWNMLAQPLPNSSTVAPPPIFEECTVPVAKSGRSHEAHLQANCRLLVFGSGGGSAAHPPDLRALDTYCKTPDLARFQNSAMDIANVQSKTLTYLDQCPNTFQTGAITDKSTLQLAVMDFAGLTVTSGKLLITKFFLPTVPLHRIVEVLCALYQRLYGPFVSNAVQSAYSAIRAVYENDVAPWLSEWRVSMLSASLARLPESLSENGLLPFSPSMLQQQFTWFNIDRTQQLAKSTSTSRSARESTQQKRSRRFCSKWIQDGDVTATTCSTPDCKDKHDFPPGISTFKALKETFRTLRSSGKKSKK